MSLVSLEMLEHSSVEYNSDKGTAVTEHEQQIHGPAEPQHSSAVLTSSARVYHQLGDALTSS